MRCLVTGANGFIGSHLVEMLLKQRCEVAALVRPDANLWRVQDSISSLVLLEGDLREPNEISLRVKEFAPEALIHAGWQGVTQQNRNDPDQIRCNLEGSVALMAAALESGCRTIIGLGSQAEYGPTDATLVEEMLPRPDSMYGVTKLCTGLIGQRMCLDAGARFSWLRLTAAFGPKDDPTHLIPYVMAALLQGQEPALTHGRQKWDYLYIHDVVSAIWSIVIHANAQGVYNLSSGTAVPVRRISEMIRDRVDRDLPLGFGKVPFRAGSRMVLEARNDRLRDATGWAPEVSLECGIDETLAWHRQKSGLH